MEIFPCNETLVVAVFYGMTPDARCEKPRTFEAKDIRNAPICFLRPIFFYAVPLLANCDFNLSFYPVRFNKSNLKTLYQTLPLLENGTIDLSVTSLSLLDSPLTQKLVYSTPYVTHKVFISFGSSSMVPHSTEKLIFRPLSREVWIASGSCLLGLLLFQWVTRRHPKLQSPTSLFVFVLWFYSGNLKTLLNFRDKEPPFRDLEGVLRSLESGKFSFTLPAGAKSVTFDFFKTIMDKKMLQRFHKAVDNRTVFTSTMHGFVCDAQFRKKHVSIGSLNLFYLLANRFCPHRIRNLEILDAKLPIAYESFFFGSTGKGKRLRELFSRAAEAVKAVDEADWKRVEYDRQMIRSSRSREIYYIGFGHLTMAFVLYEAAMVTCCIVLTIEKLVSVVVR